MARTVTAAEDPVLGGDGESPPPVGIGDVVAGKYRIDALVGEGGMGFVFAATHERLEERVAIKVLRPSIAANADMVERFLREARATVKLKSRHVARVFDIDTLPSGAPYLVMELLEGSDLATEIERRANGFDVAEAVRFVLDACEAVTEAHALRIVHRDLKPANLFLARHSTVGSSHVKVLDFGISRILAGSNVRRGLDTGAEAIFGTPCYMAPEQHVSAEKADERSDIFALGVILYELLTGKRPFEGEVSAVIYALMLTTQTPNVRDARADVPEELAAIVTRCLALDPEARFATVRDLRAALVPFAGEPRVFESGAHVVAAPPSSVKALPAPRTLIEEGSALPARRPSRTLPIALAMVVALAVAIVLVVLELGRAPADPGAALVASATPAASVAIDPAPSASLAPPTTMMTSPSSVPSSSSSAAASSTPRVRRAPAPATTTAAAATSHPAPAPSPSVSDSYRHRTSF